MGGDMAELSNVDRGDCAGRPRSGGLRRNSATHTVHTREPDGGFREAWPSAFS
jgi:hypothetical protein